MDTKKINGHECIYEQNMAVASTTRNHTQGIFADVERLTLHNKTRYKIRNKMIKATILGT